MDIQNWKPLIDAVHAQLKALEKPSDIPDAKTTEEEKDLEHQKAEVELEHQRTLITGLRNDIKQRFTYANRIFALIVGWLFALVVLVLLQGFGGAFCYEFNLDNDVLITFIGGTTVNVLGLFGIVVAYLFKK